MKKIFSRGGITKIFPQKVTIYIIALLSSLFISTLLSQGAFAATGSTVITVQSSSGEATAKTLNAWASESVTLVGLETPVGGNCNSEPNKDNVWGKKKCITAYIEGYNDRKNNTVARDDFCTKSGASDGKCPIAYDGGAYLARMEARGATADLTAAELKAKRDEYCLSKSDDENKQGVSPKEACEKGYNAGYKGTSKDSACKNLGNVEDDCKDAYDAGDAMARGQDTSPSAGGASTEDIPCVGGPMGWVLCPIINYMGDGIVALAGFMDSMMQFKLLLNTDSQNQIQKAVSSFTAVANLILVVAFLLIIFSQTTSLGLSNYGIKKMLPRVIITAILINLSFYICAFAIDISNIVGNAIMGFITGQGATNASISEGLTEATKLSGPGAVSTVFSTVLGAAIGVILVIMFLGPLALGMFITFVILVARQVILLFLILVAPLAFAAWLLPNTESWFKKWKDLFISMLIIYPMLMAIFGTALFAAKFISQIAETSSVEESGPVVGDAIAPLISLLVLAIPLLALPFILRSSNAMLGKIGNAAQKYGGQQASGKMGDSLKKAPGVRSGYEMMEQRKSTRDAAYNRLKAGRSTKRASGFRGAVVGGVIPGRLSKVNEAAHEGMAGQAAAIAQKLEQEEIDNRQKVMENMPNYATDNIEIARKELERAHYAGDKVGVRAALAQLSSSNPGTDVAHSMLRGFETGVYQDPFKKDKEGEFSSMQASMNDEQRQNLATGINDNWGTLKGRDASITKWSGGGTMEDVEKGKGTYDGLTVEQLSKQTPEAIAKAAKSKGISKEIAKSILNSSAQSNLSTESREVLEELVRDEPGNTSPDSGGGTPPPPSGPQSNSYSTRNSTGTSPGVDVKFNK